VPRDRIREWSRLVPVAQPRPAVAGVRVVPEAPAVPAVPAVPAAVVVAAGTTAAVAAALPALPVALPEVAEDSAAVLVGAADVVAVAAERPAPSVVPVAAVRFAAASPRSSAVKSSTTCRPRRWVGCPCRAETAPSFGFRGGPR